jgi:hypothetical protein
LFDKYTSYSREKAPLFLQRLIFFHILIFGGLFLVEADVSTSLNALKNMFVIKDSFNLNTIFTHDFVLIYISIGFVLVIEKFEKSILNFENYLIPITCLLVFLTIIFRAKESFIFMYLNM